MTIEDRVRSLFSAVLGIQIPDGLVVRRGEEPKWDSLKHVELILTIEDEFGVEFTVDEMAALSNLNEVVRKIEAECAS